MYIINQTNTNMKAKEKLLPSLTKAWLLLVLFVTVAFK